MGPWTLQRVDDGPLSPQVCSASRAHHRSACISHQWLTTLTPGSQQLEQLGMLDSQLGVVPVLLTWTIPAESLRAGFHGDTGLPFSLHVGSHPLGDGDQTCTRMAEGSETKREP